LRTTEDKPHEGMKGVTSRHLQEIISAACMQRSRCRIAIRVLLSSPEEIAVTQSCLRPKHKRNSMKQFLTSQDVSTPRTAAANAARRYCAELRP
jgi:hypothetical protein